MALFLLIMELDCLEVIFSNCHIVTIRYFPLFEFELNKIVIIEKL